jgi:hypothetical protein
MDWTEQRIADRIKQGWNYTSGFEKDVELIVVDGVVSIAKWPTASPPTMLEILSIQLPDENQRFVTPTEFIALLTDAEIVAFQTSTNATVIRHWIGLRTDSTDLNSLDTIEMFDFFVSLNLLTQARSSEILG